MDKGKEVTVHFDWTAGSSDTLTALINLNEYPVVQFRDETTLDDNKITVKLPIELRNLKAKITSIPSEYPNPGASVTINGQITNENDQQITTTVRWSLNGSTAYESQVTLDKTKNLAFPFSMPDKDVVVTLKVNPNRDMPPNETTWADNKDSVTIKKNNLKPILNDNLRLTARSQGGEDLFGNYNPPQDRTPGTAKWGDIVTAELAARGAPDLGSCYSLKTWKLESAIIEFPKKHPDFTFGSPLEPVGKETMSMNITGDRTAIIKFRENWSLNGAEIYDPLKGQKVPGPTCYDIKVTYTMLWEYRKGHRGCCGEEECDPCCKDWEDYEKHPTYTVTAKLLVNGTGVQPFAH